MARLLIIEARFYADIADLLLEGTVEAIEKESHDFDKITVPGALEIPGAIAMSADYDAYVALGCVIRGETSHYDTVCNESARGIMDLTLQGYCIGNGILTCENMQQAIARADKKQKNKGAGAVEAALSLLSIKQRGRSVV